MYGYIYKTINTLNGMMYIGQKKSEKFLGTKYLGSGKRLWEAIRKYGKEVFSVELLEEVESRDLMDSREIYWISFYNSTNKCIGYNLSEGGNVNRTFVGENNPFYGQKHSEDTKSHLRDIWYECHLIGPMKGKHHSEETKKRIGDKNRGRVKTPEEIQKHKDTWNSHEHVVTEETRHKISSAKKGKTGKAKGKIHITNDLEDKMIYIDELSFYESLGWRRGRKKFSPESCKRISDGHKGEKAHNKNKIWITNGTINKFIYESELSNYISDGWSRGMTKK